MTNLSITHFNIPPITIDVDKGVTLVITDGDGNEIVNSELGHEYGVDNIWFDEQGNTVQLSAEKTEIATTLIDITEHEGETYHIWLGVKDINAEFAEAVGLALEKSYVIPTTNIGFALMAMLAFYSEMKEGDIKTKKAVFTKSNDAGAYNDLKAFVDFCVENKASKITFEIGYSGLPYVVNKVVDDGSDKFVYVCFDRLADNNVWGTYMFYLDEFSESVTIVVNAQRYVDVDAEPAEN